MLRIVAIIAAFALAAPTLAAAQEHHEGKPPPGKPAGRPPGPPPGAPHGPPPGGARPGFVGHPGGPGFAGHPGGPMVWHGHPVTRVHVAPFLYPPGWGYRRWAVGAALPPLFLAPAYYYSGWATLGLPPPEPGFQWVRYGPDLLLVNVATGQVVDVIYDAFY